MSDSFFSGTWHGKYTYGEGYGPAYHGVSTAFEISLTLERGILKGYCIDDPKVYPMKQPATIEGFIEGNLISFIKKYACAWSIDYNGNVIEYPQKPSHEIHYTGYFEEGLFKGEWEIMSNKEVDRNGNILSNSLDGNWSMKHVDD
ncbi:hypothetical protein SAMN05421788_11370 [Filimonas lacunae]|uniref:Uncharacterized protein n=1 Tax=Filimonas lacunae TaxID=477680 RepID=A0A173MBP8_9BACT|nr:hypothetical protein [Filimonas lacunae]BAV04975.1 hypothetical protein FLA_0980 [Filimonas lacunae]SIT33710.1 hypothetical protein SAMN05421788_11370 [Filimonas lacunae]